MKVYLDDERPTPDGWTHARWPEEAIRLLETGEVTELSLGHDLADDEHGTGSTVILWLEEAVATRGFVPPVITAHTSNASARQKMLLREEHSAVSCQRSAGREEQSAVRRTNSQEQGTRFSPTPGF